MAVIFPFWSTFATSSLSDSQDNVLSITVFSGMILDFNWYIEFKFIYNSFLSKAICNIFELSSTNLNRIASILFFSSPAICPDFTQFCQPMFDEWTWYSNLYPGRSKFKFIALIALFWPVVPKTVFGFISS